MSKYGRKLQDPRWQIKRLKIMERDGFTCWDCKSTTKELQVHHCFYEKGDPWDTGDEFLITLCCDCHPIRQAAEATLRRTVGKVLPLLRVKEIAKARLALVDSFKPEGFR